MSARSAGADARRRRKLARAWNSRCERPLRARRGIGAQTKGAKWVFVWQLYKMPHFVCLAASHCISVRSGGQSYKMIHFVRRRGGGTRPEILHLPCYRRAGGTDPQPVVDARTPAQCPRPHRPTHSTNAHRRTEDRGAGMPARERARRRERTQARCTFWRAAPRRGTRRAAARRMRVAQARERAERATSEWEKLFSVNFGRSS